MTVEDFEASIAQPAPPSGVAPLLVALWHERRGDWDRAHGIAQRLFTPDAAWVHAYLHRREGDLGNAAYWYHHAQQPVARGSLDDEWRAITAALLGA